MGMAGAGSTCRLGPGPTPGGPAATATGAAAGAQNDTHSCRSILHAVGCTAPAAQMKPPPSEPSLSIPSLSAQLRTVMQLGSRPSWLTGDMSIEVEIASGC